MFVSVLGIDPGLTRCGYGIVTIDENKNVAFDCVGILSTSPQDQVSARLAEIHSDLEQLISEKKPDFISIERVLFQNNVSTAMSVGQVSGLVHSLSSRFSIPITEYSPNEVKNAITGDGRADKSAIQSMVMKLLKLTKLPQPADAADALAIALTHAYQIQTPKNKDTSDNATYNGSNLHNAIADAIISQVKKQPKVKTQEREVQYRTRKRPGIAR